MRINWDPTIQDFQRFEFKYVVPNQVALAIRDEVKEFLVLDPNLEKTGQESYVVRSLYFDNPSADFFYEKTDGLKTRRKYRLRAYGSTRSAVSNFFLEQKGRHNEKTFKHRKPFDISELTHFYADGGIPWLENRFSEHQFIKDYVFDTIRRGLQPSVVVEYQRRPFISKQDVYFRITFDSDLTCLGSQELFPETQDLLRCIPGCTVIELKFLRSIPRWFHRIIQNFELRRVSISKFVVGMKVGGIAVDLS
jgi:hypothetical protein|tara:strand:+ start:452 stop:1201 length:750 start_codon:yes stop_codon:yes gene_type:complete